MDFNPHAEPLTKKRLGEIEFNQVTRRTRHPEATLVLWVLPRITGLKATTIFPVTLEFDVCPLGENPFNID
jgi:hypothetical protein